MNTNPLGDGQTCLSPFDYTPLDARSHYFLVRLRAARKVKVIREKISPEERRLRDLADKEFFEEKERMALEVWMKSFRD